MIAFPPAKINLGLNIITKRNDGFHAIESVFYPISWTDVIEVIKTENQEFKFNSSGLKIPGNRDNNLIVNACKLLQKDFDLPGLSFHLHKILPMGAGLGGGSSDGAFALMLINNICKLGLNKEKLKYYALELGSDCPFFIDEKPMFVSGRGEHLEEINVDLKNWYIVVVMPPFSVGTAEAYRWIQPKAPEISIKAIISSSPENWKNNLTNDFEEEVIQRHALVGEIKTELYQQGAVYASMSGSGAAVYGLFKSKPESPLFPNMNEWCGIL